MLKLQKIIMSMMMVVMLLGSVSMMVTQPASAAGALTATDFGIDQPKATGLPDKDVREVIAYIIRVILGLLGTICVVTILYAGFLYMTSGGNAEKQGQAVGWIKGAVIGLALILLSYALSKYIITQLISATGGGTAAGTI
jgi:ABC-type Fe3+-siderophore transport system permease subunit